VIEAIAAHTPVIASRIDGNIGPARARLPGTVRGGDARGAARLVERAARRAGLSAHASRSGVSGGQACSQPAREAGAVNALVDNVAAKRTRTQQ